MIQAGGCNRREIYPNLFVGGNEACTRSTDRAVVHACKEPCHRRAVGYQGNLNRGHPEYLVALRGNHLFLNIVDMDQQLRHEFAGPIVVATLDFIESRIDTQDIAVHCNEGRSRAPSIAMVYLSKRASVLPDRGFSEAAQAFRELFPEYAPGTGIASYLRAHWQQIR